MPEGERSAPNVPEARAVSSKQTRLSLVWIIPIVAAIAGAWVAVTRILAEGPKITIVFKSAEGLDAGKTQIHYNGVNVGTITTIRLSDDHRSVIATAQMAPKTQDFLVDDTHFWVVRPRISGATVSGLGTLISGAYIGMAIGTSKQEKPAFVAIDAQLVVTGDVPGRFFVLKTPDLGSLDIGTPLYFRRLEVGQVASYSLDDDGKSLSVRVFVRAPYDQYVTPDTRFWQASGFDMSLSASASRSRHSRCSRSSSAASRSRRRRPGSTSPPPSPRPSSACSAIARTRSSCPPATRRATGWSSRSLCAGSSPAPRWSSGESGSARSRRCAPSSTRSRTNSRCQWSSGWIRRASASSSSARPPRR